VNPIVIISTMADPKRPGLTYRVEFDNEDQVLQWLDTKFILLEKQRIWAEGAEGVNTTISVFHADNTVTQHMLRGQWDQVTNLLELAEDIEAHSTGYIGRGRPPRRVLQTTTSKERREGKQRPQF
jgi:hypothetical protein